MAAVPHSIDISGTTTITREMPKQSDKWFFTKLIDLCLGRKSTMSEGDFVQRLISEFGLASTLSIRNGAIITIPHDKNKGFFSKKNSHLFFAEALKFANCGQPAILGDYYSFSGIMLSIKPNSQMDQMQRENMRSNLIQGIKLSAKLVAINKLTDLIQKNGGFEHFIFYSQGNFFSLIVDDLKAVNKVRLLLERLGFIINEPMHNNAPGSYGYKAGTLQFPQVKGEKEEREMFERIIGEVDRYENEPYYDVMSQQITATASAASPAQMLTAFISATEKSNVDSKTSIRHTAHTESPSILASLNNDQPSNSVATNVTKRTVFHNPNT